MKNKKYKKLNSHFISSTLDMRYINFVISNPQTCLWRAHSLGSSTFNFINKIIIILFLMLTKNERDVVSCTVYLFIEYKGIKLFLSVFSLFLPTLQSFAL